jgi:cysteine desulfurase
VLEAELRKIPEICIFAEQAERLPNTVQFGLRQCHGETLLLQLDRAGVAVSSGSACHSDVRQPSHVLVAMGVESELAMTAIRVSLSMQTTEQDIAELVKVLNSLVGEFRITTVRAVNA